MKHYFIENPISGKGENKNYFFDYIQPILLHENISYAYYQTKYKGDGTRYVKEVLENNQNDTCRFYAIGGDGTLYEVLNGVYGQTNAEVTSIPKGSGNDYLRLYGGRDLFMDVEKLIHGVSISVDGILVTDQDKNTEVAINQTSAGFDAEACAMQAAMKKLPFTFGHMSYVFGGLYCMFTHVYHTFKLMIDCKPIKGPFFFAVACNSRWYGSGIKVAPFASPQDGLFDVVVIRREQTWPEIVKLALVDWQKKGTHYLDRSCVYERCKKISISSDKPFMINVDGETRKVTSVTLDTIPNAFHFVIPNNSPYLATTLDATIQIPQKPTNQTLYDKLINDKLHHIR